MVNVTNTNHLASLEYDWHNEDGEESDGEDSDFSVSDTSSSEYDEDQESFDMESGGDSAEEELDEEGI